MSWWWRTARHSKIVFSSKVLFDESSNSLLSKLNLETPGFFSVVWYRCFIVFIGATST